MPDWIKMRPTLLGESPKVLTMVKFLSNQPAFLEWLSPERNGASRRVAKRALHYVTVGGLLRVWGAANMHTTDGSFSRLDLADLDDLAGIPCFGLAMAAAGWAVETDRGVILPNFLEHNDPEPLRRCEPKTAAQRAREYRMRKKLASSALERSAENGASHARHNRHARHDREEKRREESFSKEKDDVVDGRLWEIFNCWSELREPIVMPANATHGTPGEPILKAWRKARADSQVGHLFDDVTAIFAAIKRSRFCHGQWWFSLKWLFSKNRGGEWNIAKLLGGAFVECGPGRPQPKFRPFSEVAKERGIFDE